MKRARVQDLTDAPRHRHQQRVPPSISRAASTPPESIRFVDSRRPLGSDQRERYVAPNPRARLNTR